MKKILLGLLIGNAIHFGAREAGSILKAYRRHECINSYGAKCRDATIVENILMFEIDLGSKMFDY